MGGSSWLTAVKRAFRSPTKDAHKKTARRSREQNEQELDEDEKKREKRRWLFRKHSSTTPTKPPAAPVPFHPPPHDHRHAIAVAAATAAAAEAAVATAQAAVEIIRLTRSSNPTIIKPSSIKHSYAATVIQKAFRGYLARRALVALRGIVKLQALIRGQIVRKQAKMTLRCVQAMLRLQTRMHPSRLSQDGGSRKSMFAENSNSLWDSTVRERRSMSRDRRGSNSSIDWNWNDCPRTLQELEECLQSRKEAAALRRESSSSSSLAQKIWNAENEMNGERTNWLEQWMETKQWRDEHQQQPMYRDSNRASTDRRDSFVKTVEMDTMNNNNNSTPKRRTHSSAATCPSPGRSSFKAPSTPSSKMRTPPPPPSHSYSHSAANTPSLRSVQRLSSSISRNTAPAAVPNYMAATESARARIRSQSAPRQRPSTPEKDRGGGMAKKRLSFPVPPAAANGYSQSLRSPSFKSVQAGYVGMEQHSNQSCYTDSLGGEISPCSTTELRWWLRT